jgi:hypothetical protein
MLKSLFATVLIAALLAAAPAEAKLLRFAGYDFNIKEGSGLGPGPNSWASSQAFVDSHGRLHLRLSKRNGQWYSGEVSTVSRLGFGTYEIEFEGDIAGLDKDVVFGFFHYPTADIGADATNEIDIEFARWGSEANPPLNYTVWPVDGSLNYVHKGLAFPARQGRSLHRYSWRSGHVAYYSAMLRDNGEVRKSVTWTFKPKNPKKRIGQQPMPLFFNLWGRKGLPPSDGEAVEVIINSFKYTPAQ